MNSRIKSIDFGSKFIIKFILILHTEEEEGEKTLMHKCTKMKKKIKEKHTKNINTPFIRNKNRSIIIIIIMTLIIIIIITEKKTYLD